MRPVPPELTGPSGFKNFLWLAWKALGLPHPTPVQYDIADFLQHGGDRIVVMAFRGVGKSYITSAFVVYTLLLDPTKLLQIVSGSKIRADDFSTFTLQMIKVMGDLTAHLLPREDQRSSKVAFDVGPAPPSQSPSVTSKGLFSQLTGGRADIMVADDVVTKQNSLTQVMRDKAKGAVEEFNAILKPGGRIVYLGTPQCEQDLLHELADLGYTVRIWPAEVPNQKLLTSYGERLAPVIQKMVDEGVPAGMPTDPDRFDAEDLEKRRLGYGKTGYAMQFLLDHSLADADRYPLRINDLIVDDLDIKMCKEKYVWSNDPSLRVTEPPCSGFRGDFWHRPLSRVGEMVPYTTAVMSIDPSGRGADETGYAVVAGYGGQLFVLDCGGIKGGYDERVLSELAALAKRYGVSKIVIEENFGQGMFEALLQPVLLKVGYACSIETVRHHTQKERRICDVLEPLMNQHKLIVNRSVWARDWESVKVHDPEDQRSFMLAYQLSRITRDRGALNHEDRLDALAMACQWWVDSVRVDVDKRMVMAGEERSRRAFERFLQHAIGKPAPRHQLFYEARPIN